MKTATALIHLFLLAACLANTMPGGEFKMSGMRRAVEDATKEGYRLPKLPGVVVVNV